MERSSRKLVAAGAGIVIENRRGRIEVVAAADWIVRKGRPGAVVAWIDQTSYSAVVAGSTDRKGYFEAVETSIDRRDSSVEVAGPAAAAALVAAADHRRGIRQTGPYRLSQIRFLLVEQVSTRTTSFRLQIKSSPAVVRLAVVRLAVAAASAAVDPQRMTLLPMPPAVAADSQTYHHPSLPDSPAEKRQS